MEIERIVTRNATNKRVEENVKKIVETLVAKGYSRTEIAEHAQVSLTAVMGWEKRNRADAAVIDRLLESVSKEQPKSFSKEQSSKPVSGEGDGDISKLLEHIDAIKKMGFNVSLTPIE